MRVTKEMLVRENSTLRHELNTALRELQDARRWQDDKTRLSDRLLTIFERTAGEANLRLSGSGGVGQAMNYDQQARVRGR